MKKKKAFSSLEILLLILAALVVVAAPYYFFVQKPVTEGIAQAQQEASGYESEMTILMARRTKMKAMEDEIADRKKDPDAAVIQPYDNQSRVIDFLYSVLKEKTSDITINQSIALPQEGSYVARRTMTISYTCPSYYESVALVKDLETCPYLSQIKTLSVSPVTNRNNQTSIFNAVTDGPVQTYLNIIFFEDYSGK